MPPETPPHGFRTFVLIWLSQSVSVFGSALTFFATTIWLTQTLYPKPEQKPELAAALAAITLCFALPSVFGAPIAGAWADRHDRKRTMLVCDTVSGGLSLIYTLLLISGGLQLWMVLVLMVGFATAGAFHGSAFDTSYAMLVPEAQLPRANGMMQTIWSLSGILSPAMAATIIALPALARQGQLIDSLRSGLAGLQDGTPLATGLDAATFFFAMGVLLFLRVPSPVRTDLGTPGGKPQKSIWADIAEGARYIRRRPSMLWLLGTFSVANFAASPIGVFEPLLIKFNLAADWTARGSTFEQSLAVLASVGAVGGVVGGVFISTWGGLKRRRIYGVLVPMILAGVAQVLFGLSGLVYFSAAMAFVLNAMTPLLNAHSQAIWQKQTPRELQGRVFSVRRVIAQFTFPLSVMLAGLSGGIFDPGIVVAVLGAILTVFCVAQLFNPYLRRVEDKAWLDAQAGEGPIPVLPDAALPLTGSVAPAEEPAHVG
ncbi:MAG: MFS transporter [Chloroflexota bacterium]|nr:MFS transporter [Chloroflexota bacterium]